MTIVIAPIIEPNPFTQSKRGKMKPILLVHKIIIRQVTANVESVVRCSQLNAEKWEFTQVHRESLVE